MPSFSAHLLATDSAQSALFALSTAPNRQGAYDPFGYGYGTAARPAFDGQVLEALSGCYLLGHGHRAYSPVLRRFWLPDRLSPFGAGGLNAYMYCKGDPVNYQDPSGRMARPMAGIGLIMAIVGGGLLSVDGAGAQAVGSGLLGAGVLLGVGGLAGMAAGGRRGSTLVPNVQSRPRFSSLSLPESRSFAGSPSATTSSGGSVIVRMNSGSFSSGVPISQRGGSRRSTLWSYNAWPSSRGDSEVFYGAFEAPFNRRLDLSDTAFAPNRLPSGLADMNPRRSLEIPRHKRANVRQRWSFAV